LDGESNWERLLYQVEEKLFNAMPKLWHVSEVAMKELSFLLDVYCGIMQLEERIDYHVQLYKDKPKKH
jgi:hypothetical protein